MHNFIDWRINSAPRSISENKKLYELCKNIRESVRESSKDSDAILLLIERCQKLAKLLPNEYLSTKKALESYVVGMKNYHNNGEISAKLFKDFTKASRIFFL